MAAKTRAATLIVAREEKIRYIQNYTKLDKTIEQTLDITKIYNNNCTAAATDVESTVGDDSMGGLCDVSGMDEVVVRVSVLAVSLLHHRQEVLQTERVDLQHNRTTVTP